MKNGNKRQRNFDDADSTNRITSLQTMNCSLVFIYFWNNRYKKTITKNFFWHITLRRTYLYSLVLVGIWQFRRIDLYSDLSVSFVLPVFNVIFVQFGIKIHMITCWIIWNNYLNSSHQVHQICIWSNMVDI